MEGARMSNEALAAMWRMVAMIQAKLKEKTL
jgi:diadenosine tetraphosphate (Ap4A) HIT family hydrolase